MPPMMNDDADALDADDTVDTGADEGGAGTQETTKVAAGAADKATDGQMTAANWDEKWRDKMIAGLPETQREKAKPYLAKRSSPYDVLNAALSADAKISEVTRDRVKIPTGKNDDPKEVERFRKAMGIPEKPEDYKFEIPKEYGTPSELDTELIGEFQQEMHAAGANQKQVEVASRMYFAVQQRANAAKAAEAMALDRKGEQEIKGFHGKAFPQVVELTNRMMADGLGKYGWTEPQQRTDFLSMRLENGQKLGSFPPFVNFMADLAKERADEGAFDMGDGDDGEDTNAQIAKIIATRDTDPKGYARADTQATLDKLIAKQQRMSRRK